MQMRAEIARIQKRLATTTVYVTHDQVEAMTLGGRIAVMRAGRLQQVGTPLDVYRRPANLFVAGFVGSPPMNLLPVRVADDGRTLEGAGFRMPVPRRFGAVLAGQAGRELIAGVRPERLTEANGEGDRSGGSVRLVAEVTLAEPLGSEVVVHAHGERDQLLIARLGADRIDRVPDIGSRIELALDPEAVHLFDAASEERIEEPVEAAA
jgi:multiple sugar transport system ATP-binding protein